MKSRYVVRLFFSTLLVGGVSAAIFGFIIRWSEFEPYFTDFDILKILSTVAWLFGVGLIFSVISQMGFFAYLTVHRFGLGILRSARLWNSIQIILVAFALFDLVYLRYSAFGGELTPYLLDAGLILIVALIVAIAKSKQTNKEAFIPALFFMVVISIIEWVPVLRINEESLIYLMIYPLLICNTYQLLILHKYNQLSEQDKKPSK